MNQLHASLRGCPPGFPQIAGEAATHHILPAVISSSTPRHDVIYGEVFDSLPAVLADELISIEYLEAGEFPLKARTHDILCESYDGRNRKCRIYGVDLTPPILNDFRFSVHDENDCPLHPAYIERLVVLVQDQYRDIDLIHRITLDFAIEKAFREEALQAGTYHEHSFRSRKARH